MFEVNIPEWSDMVLMTRYENIKPSIAEVLISKVRLYASYKSFNGFPEGA